MPFNIHDPTKNINNVVIKYNYVDISIYQFENTLKKDSFIRIPYLSNKTEPNVTINDNNVNTMYKTSKLYIVKPQNLIQDLSYSAELIVEHRSMTNDNTLYTCFLLKSNPELEEKTNIDELIIDASNGTKPTSKKLLLQNLSYNNNNDPTIYYHSNNDRVVILTKPFEIKSSFDSNFTNLVPKLFSIDEIDYKMIQPKKEEGFQNKENVIEGFTKNMYCQPVDMTDLSGGGIISEPELSIPLDGNYIKNASTNTLVKTAVYFCAFIIVLALCYIIIPIVYNDYVIGLIEISNAKLKLNRIRSIDIILVLCSYFLFS